MKSKAVFYLLLFITLACNTPKPETRNLVSYVDPFIGTGGHGHTFPGATMPFGMMQLSPDTRLDGWDGCSGYHFSDSVVHGFSHTHLSGTGVSDYGDILLMPMSGLKGKSKFNKQTEIAEPGYYKMDLIDPKIKVELTTSERAGFHKYTFAKGDSQFVYLDLDHRDQTIKWFFEDSTGSTVSGYRISKSWAEEQHLYFALEFSKPIGDRVYDPAFGYAWYHFPNDTNSELLVKIGISAVSVENAKANLEAEIPHWDFEKTRLEAKDAWEKQLSKIEVKGKEEDKVKFYTSLYHTMIAPNLFSDVNGDYLGMDMKIHNIGDNKEQYTVFSLWDTFRATHPLYTLIEQDRTNAFIQTFLRQYQQGGLLPVWELAANETNCMIGYHSVPVITDAYTKGIRDYNELLALKAMVTSANQDEHGLKFYKAQGCINAGDESESVSKTLAYAYDDWCIAVFADSLNQENWAKQFYKRRENWKNLFDPNTRFFRARVNNGWFSPFLPEEVNFNYTEANAWQYSMFVPHDIYELAKQMHINEKLISSHGAMGLERHLDNMFSAKSETSGREQADITGLIGQYAHGNEPSHHMAYLYNYRGRADKTQKLVTQIKEELYTTQPDGLSGNEDCGQMSAWYVLSAMGFYSVTPGQPYYVIGSPTFEEATINLENGKQFTIKANGLQPGYFSIQSGTLNGKPFNQTYLEHNTIMEGGELVFEMGATPSDWGKEKEAWPPQKANKNQLIPTPFFTTENNTFKDTLRVGVGSLCSDCELYIKINEGDEQTNWLKQNEVLLEHDAGIWAFAKHSDGRSSDTIYTMFYQLDQKLKLSLKSEYANQYSAGGDNALIDRQYGTANFRTGSWQGYQGHDFEAYLDLGEPKQEVEISIGFLQDIKSWIWYPEKVEVWVYYGDDNIEIYEAYPEPGLEKQEGEMRTTVTLKIKQASQEIKIVATNRGPCPPWHLGAGGKSWLFIDEIEVN